MTTRDALVAESRTWIGTKFVHQGRLKGVGVDCIGLIAQTAQATGVLDVDETNYGRTPDPARMRKALMTHLDPVAFKDLLPGDILWFRVIRQPQHVGLVTQVVPKLRMVHAYSRRTLNECVEQDVDGFWRSRVVGCFRFRGID